MTEKVNLDQGKTNAVGLTRQDYKGSPTTLCPGCGHNSISNQIITACYELDIVPEELVKFSGIGCSSKSPTYFLETFLWVQWFAWQDAFFGAWYLIC